MKIRTLARRKAKTAFTPNRSFRNFQALPPEIRYEIWAWSLPDPRIICLQKSRQRIPGPLQNNSIGASLSPESQDTNSTSQTNNLENDMVYWSQTDSPDIYSVCRESQAVFKQFYTKMFATSNSPGIWIDLRVDSLYLAREIYERYSIFYKTFQPDIHQVKNLIISGIWDQDSTASTNRIFEIDTIEDIGAAITGFKNLEFLMLADSQHRWDQTVYLYDASRKTLKEYDRFLQEHPAFCPEYCDADGWYLWPRIVFGTLLAIEDFRLQDNRLRRTIRRLEWRYEDLLSDVSWWFRRVSG